MKTFTLKLASRVLSKIEPYEKHLGHILAFIIIGSLFFLALLIEANF